ncbi:MAG: Mfa1 family fimbria major subunit [Tannerella sp.]|nr:Mfa1 family fimbria major subunit [Tannerella sp.]
MFKFFASAAFVAAMGLIGCTTSDGPGPSKPDPNKPEVVEGKPTFATFTFEFADAPSTRAGVSPEQQGTENTTINDIRLFVFNVNGDCEANAYVDGANVGTGTGGRVSKTVQVTSGQKRVLVIANAGNTGTLGVYLNGLNDKASGLTPIATFDGVKEQIWDLDNTTAGGGGGLAGGLLTLTGGNAPAWQTNGLAALNQFVTTTGGTSVYIYSNAVDSASIKNLNPFISEDDSKKGSGTAGTPTPKDSVNHFLINVQREVAKVAVGVGASGTGPGQTDFSVQDNSGWITPASLLYTMENINRGLYLFQRFTSDNIVSQPAAPGILLATPKSPFYDYNFLANASPVWTANSWTTYWYRGYGGTAESSTPTTPLPNPATGSPGNGFLPVANPAGAAVYVTENTNTIGGYWAQTTYAAISGVFVPAANKMIVTTNSANLPADTTTYTYNSTNGMYSGFPLNTTTNPAAPSHPIPTAGILYQLQIPAGYICPALPDGIFVQNKYVAYRLAYAINNIIFNSATALAAPAAGMLPPTSPAFTGALTNMVIPAPAGTPGIDPTYGLLYNKEHNNNANVCLVKEYQNGGTCYYRQDIGELNGTSWKIRAVKRNHFYQVLVTGFKSIGDPNPGDVNYPPNTPNEAPTHITATITVDPWRNVIIQNPVEPR